MSRTGRYVALCTLALAAIAHAAVLRDHLYGVKALSATEGWAVGNFGSIYHTKDAGKTWDPRESGTRNPLFSVDFADAQHGWAVGKSATILATTDGGRTWRRQAVTAAPREGTDGGELGDKHLFKVVAVDARTAWAVGDWGAMVRTTDGGQRWEDRSLGVVTVRVDEEPGRALNTVTDDVILYDVTFPDARHGYVAGEFGTVLRTTDGGETWSRSDTGTEKTLFGVHFTTPEEGWAVGIDGILLRTRDGGGHWEFQRGEAAVAALEDVGFLAAIRNPGLYAVKVVGRHGIIVGDTGVLLVSGDGGEQWTRLELPDKDRLVWMRDVDLAPGSHGFAVGANGFSAQVARDTVALPGGGAAAPVATP
jgi:photosystem II stability/assembly factor-like uncharacterized protein